MLKKSLLLLAMYLCLPTQSFADVTGTTLIPLGIEYSARGDGLSKPGNAYYGAAWGNHDNYVIHFNTPRPQHIAANNSRHTIAMDVHFLGNYLTTDNHLVFMSHHSGGPYNAFRDHRSGAIIAGGLLSNPGRVNVEGVEMTDSADPKQNEHKGITVGVLTANKWYRIALDFISLNGSYALGGRVWEVANGVVGAKIYDSGAQWSDFAWNYDLIAQNQTVSIATIHTEGAPSAGFQYSNLKSYWMTGSEWVPTP